MKYTIIPFFALTSVVSAANLIPPNYYPPNDEYSIFNVELKNRVIDNQGNFSPGHVIGSYIRFSGSVSPNLKFAVNGCTFNEGEGRNVSIQSYAAVHSANGSGGFVSTNGSGIIESQESVSWVLKPVANTREQFMIIKDNLAITALTGVPGIYRQWPLAAQAINTSDTRQYWIFVPLDQIEAYLSNNNLKPS